MLKNKNKPFKNKFNDDENLHKNDKIVINNVEIKINPSTRNRPEPQLINARCRICNIYKDIDPIFVRKVDGEIVFTCDKHYTGK